MTRFAVEHWSPEYGATIDAPNGRPESRVDEGVEVEAAAWAPMRPAPGTAIPDSVLFVDGVQRIDAWIWIDDGTAAPRAGICASWAAGLVRCDGAPGERGRATIEGTVVGRGLFTPAVADPIRTPHGDWEVFPTPGETIEDLRHGLQQAMGESEVAVAVAAAPAVLVVVDGPLRGRQNVPGAIGYVKRHHVHYLSEDARRVVGALAPGERTPLFLVGDAWTRYSWYVRLPGGGGHAWSGIVRCEAPAEGGAVSAARVADASAAALPRYASAAHKDPRAPQNLTPVAGLERDLRHRLGDPRLLYRSLRAAAA